MRHERAKPAGIVALVVAGLLTCGSSSAPGRTRGALIHIDPEKYDFGRVYGRRELTCTIEVSSRGSMCLVLDPNIITSCGCAVGTLERVRLLPGETAALRVVLDVGRIRGEFRKQYVIKSNDPSRPIVVGTIVGENVPILSQKGFLGLYGDMSDESVRATCELTVARRATSTGMPLGIDAILSVSPCVEARILHTRATEQECLYEVEVYYYPAKDGEGLRRTARHELLVRFNDPNYSDYLPFVIDVTDGVKVTPQRILLLCEGALAGARQEICQRGVRIESINKEPLRITRIVSGKGLRCEHRRLSDTVSEVEVFQDRNSADGSERGEVIRVEAQLGEAQRVLNIPVVRMRI